MAPKATTIDQYLKALPSNDRVIVTAVLDLIRSNIAEGFLESMTWGFPCFEVPVERFTATVEGEPLVYAAIEAEKRRFGLYLTPLYRGSEAELDFRNRWRSPSKRMVDLGASCVRFRALKDLDQALIADVIGSMTLEEFISSYHRTDDR